MSLRNNTLDDIAAVIGFSATLRLSAWYGDGGNLYIPANVDEDSLLTRLLGISAAKALSKEWGGEHLAIPRLTNYEEDARKKMICRMLEKGFGTREVSSYMRVSERRVQQICRELEVEGLLTPIARQDVR